MTTQQEIQKESSLTAPSDRDLENRWRPEQEKPVLTNEETKSAMAELNNTSFISKFPQVDRTYADPAIPMQNITLFSFIPAKGATSNSAGIFGFGKFRGAFSTAEEADQRAEFLIRNVDSYHKIFHAYAGRPFPITVNSNFSAETSEIDIRKEMTKSISNSVKEHKSNEERTVQEIRNREENLLEESRADPEDVDPYDEYITLKVKKAQLSWTYLEHIKKIEEIKDIIIKTRKHLAELDTKNSEFQDKYYDKYMKARKESGFEDKQTAEDNFMKFLVEDANLPGIDCVFNLTPEEVDENIKEHTQLLSPVQQGEKQEERPVFDPGPPHPRSPCLAAPGTPRSAARERGGCQMD
jgi:hypothetical protein